MQQPLLRQVARRVQLEMKVSGGSRGQQPGNLTLLRPPPASIRGGSEMRKVARQIMETWNDSPSPLLRSLTPPHIYYCTFCYPLDTVSLTDWLTGWLTNCHPPLSCPGIQWSMESPELYHSFNKIYLAFNLHSRPCINWNAASIINGKTHCCILTWLSCYFV